MFALRFVTVSLAFFTSIGCMSLNGAGGPDPVGGAGGEDFGGSPRGEWALPGGQEASWSSDVAAGNGSSGTSTPDLACSFGASTTYLTIPASRTFGSPALARALTRAGKLPDPARIREADFLNYYPVAYDDDGKAGGAISCHAGLAPGLLSNQFVLQIAVQPPANFKRPKVALAVVVDTSLSMAGSSFKRAQAAAKALAEGLQVGDQFTLISSKRASTKPVVVGSPADQDAARAAAAGLTLDGGEDLAGALADAYDVVSEALDGASGATVGRVVMITDGAAQATSIDLGMVAGYRQERSIPLIGVGVGEVGSYTTDFIDAATSVGGGASLFLDTESEADTLLHRRFDDLMTTVATDVQVIVDLPQAIRFQGLSPELQSDVPTGLVAATLSPGRALVFRNNVEVCDPTFIGQQWIGVTVRWRPFGSDEILENTTVGGLTDDLFKASRAQIAKAGVIAAYAEGVANLRPAVLEQAIGLASAAMKQNPSLVDDPALLEIQELAQANLDIISQSIK